MLELVKIPNEILKKPCRPLTEDEIKNGVTAEGLKLLDFSKDLVEAMKHYDGIGLAAPQVNVGLCIFAVNTKTPLVIVNPVLSEFEGTHLSDEGCLSIPGVKAVVRRYRKLRMTGFSVAGVKLDMVCRDMMANVCQHEYDHLQGILFTSKAVPGSIEQIQKKE